jgi:hypothetical protein
MQRPDLSISKPETPSSVSNTLLFYPFRATGVLTSGRNANNRAP